MRWSCRTPGTVASEGEFTPFFDEAADGADAIAWAAGQPWSAGQVGMTGGSYFGATQWLAATEAPLREGDRPVRHHRPVHESWAYQGGAFQLGFNLHWALSSLALGEVIRRLGSGAAKLADLMELIAAVDRNEELYRRTPLRGVPELAGLGGYYDDWLDHPSYDEFWRACAPRERYGAITAPALNMGGWFDLFLKGTIANYLGMKAAGGSDAARGLQRLVIGAVGARAAGRLVPGARLRAAQRHRRDGHHRPAAALVRPPAARARTTGSRTTSRCGSS